MYRGTTPNQVFKLGFLLQNEEEIYITYSQNDATVLEKHLAQISRTIDETTGFSILSFQMTQQETLIFDDSDVTIQIRIKFTDGTAIASNYIRSHVSDVLKDGEI